VRELSLFDFGVSSVERWELYEKGTPKCRIARRVGKHRETVHLWIKRIQQDGLPRFLDRYSRAKKGERKKRKAIPLLGDGFGRLGSGRLTAVARRYSTFLSVSKAFNSPSPRYMKSSRRSMLSAPNGRKIRREGRFPELRDAEK